ncbi:unnamed protein product [Caenorhabditis sp. 36 PRJEB53466]|nr:unnamed protein product [Caenorhabditis sp. 36 PRJEB53466]
MLREYDANLGADRKLIIYEKMIPELQRRLKAAEWMSDGTVYRKRPETEHVDCGRVLAGDKEYTRSLTGVYRVPLIEDPTLNMSCEAIRSRLLQPTGTVPKPLKSGIAFARIVYTDYEFIEKQVQTSFHPQNVFCFTIDKKSPPNFHEKMRALAMCVPNVILLPATEEYDSDGHNNNLAHLRCMRAVVPLAGWNYLMLLQNHDVITKSVYELEKVFEMLGGVNDVAIGAENRKRRVRMLKWDPKSLKLFRNETNIASTVLDEPLKFSTGYMQGSLCREAVEWLTNEVDPLIAINQWNQSKFGSDEQFLSSFQINEQLAMPGHFTDECLKQNIGVAPITRMSQWAVGKRENCATRQIRHNICLFGIEDLRSAATLPFLMFNKMLPSFDFSIVECIGELLHNRTHLAQADHQLDESFYENMVTVQYHKHHLEPGFVLNCTWNSSVWAYDPNF